MAHESRPILELPDTLGSRLILTGCILSTLIRLFLSITYKNILVSNISDYGIDIQQDYLNGGPTGHPTNGVMITGVTMKNITGTASSDAKDYYILCGDGSCSDFVFNDIEITGGSGSSCNFKPSGDFACSP